MKIDAYTIGHTDSYSKALGEGPVKKLGRLPDYPGGAVFRNRESAQEFIDKNNYPYSVFGLKLPNSWDEDVEESKESKEGFCRLVNDAEIINI